MKSLLGIGWQLSELHGWGVFGINMARELQRVGSPKPLLLQDPVLSPEAAQEMSQLVTEWQPLKARLGTLSLNQRLLIKDLLVIHGFGNRFTGTGRQPRVWGEANVGFIFFEETAFVEDDIAFGRSMDMILAGSTWNAQLLNLMGFASAKCVMQGVDLQRFSGERCKTMYKDRFVIFSGGKAEYRKGQDIVLQAFKVFQQRHPDALLMTAWHNPWPATAASLAAGPYETGAPQIIAESGKLDLLGWAQRNGIPSSAFIDVGFRNNREMAAIYAEADVALFPNRAEGGTNLVAMELMASSVPCIISANTGHLDLIGDDNCYPLINQSASVRPGEDGWGGSDIEEIVDQLEGVYTNREKSIKVGRSGREFISQYSWGRQVERIVDAVRYL